jgi:hypothetical protein
MAEKWTWQEVGRKMVEMVERISPGSIFSDNPPTTWTVEQTILFLHNEDQILAEAGWTREEFFKKGDRT